LADILDMPAGHNWADILDTPAEHSLAGIPDMQVEYSLAGIRDMLAERNWAAGTRDMPVEHNLAGIRDMLAERNLAAGTLDTLVEHSLAGILDTQVLENTPEYTPEQNMFRDSMMAYTEARTLVLESNSAQVNSRTAADSRELLRLSREGQQRRRWPREPSVRIHRPHARILATPPWRRELL